jgi:carboxypeptidase Taq
VAVGRLHEQLERETASLDEDSDEAALVHVTRRLYKRSAHIPSSLVPEFDEHAAAIYQAWTVARPANDFAAVRPLLEKRLSLAAAKRTAFPVTTTSPIRSST